MHIQFVHFLKNPTDRAVAAAHKYPQRREVSEQTQAEARPGPAQFKHLGGI